MPRIRITDLLAEVNSWTGFAGRFTHSVDPDLQVHGLRRQIKGIWAANLVARMDDLDIDTLPSVADAKSDQRERSKVPWVLA